MFSLDFPHFANGGGADRSGSARVVAQGAPPGRVLRYSVSEVGVTGVGVTGVGAVPARRKEGGIRTAAAMRNRGNDRTTAA